MGKLQGALIFDKPSTFSMLVSLSHLLFAMRPRRLAVLEEVEEAVACLVKCPSETEMMVGVWSSFGDEAASLHRKAVTIQKSIAKRRLREKSPRKMLACAFGSRGWNFDSGCLPGRRHYFDGWVV